jgi:hypothetical protein
VIGHWYPPGFGWDINTSEIFKVADEASFDFEAPGPLNVNQRLCWRQFDPDTFAADIAIGGAAEFNAVNIDPTRSCNLAGRHPLHRKIFSPSCPPPHHPSRCGATEKPSPRFACGGFFANGYANVGGLLRAL